VTITFGEQVENHAGMEKLGSMASEGFTVDELRTASKKLEEKGITCELVNLNDAIANTDVKNATEAAVLIIRGGVSGFIEDDKAPDDLLSEQTALKWDTQAFMYGRVVSKKARHNLCFADFEQSANYQKGQGTVVSFEKVPLLQKIRKSLEEYLGTKAKQKTMLAEGNLYYDISQCGIGFHGDAERRIVVAVRLGHTMPLHYQWFLRGKPVGTRVVLSLNHGDMYVMSEKATGFDWKKKVIPTLRHAAGSEKFTTIKEKKKKKTKKVEDKKKGDNTEEDKEQEESSEN